MNKKAFTLIELLAVIVILAIIALIAVPIVINIINDAKEESQKRSLNLYMKHVESSITKENLNEKFNPSLCLIQDNSKLICDDKEVDITINGEKPKEGTILLKNGKIIKYKNIKLGNLYYHKDLEGNETVTKEKLSGICRTDNEASTELGTKYECDVNDDKTYTFYVLSKEGYNINLIMNSNICENGVQADKYNQCNYAWNDNPNSDNRYGPYTAMTILYNATKNWTNVPDMIMNYKDENNRENEAKGYISIITNSKTKVTTITGKENRISQYQTFGSIIEPLKTRLPKENEIRKAGCSEVIASCPDWLVSNLQYWNGGSNKYLINENNGISSIQGYWLLSSYNKFSNYVNYINNVGYIYHIVGVNTINANGIRPVMSITMDELETKN